MLKAMLDQNIYTIRGGCVYLLLCIMGINFGAVLRISKSCRREVVCRLTDLNFLVLTTVFLCAFAFAHYNVLTLIARWLSTANRSIRPWSRINTSLIEDKYAPGRGKYVPGRG
jgi:hypothetical protein